MRPPRKDRVDQTGTLLLPSKASQCCIMSCNCVFRRGLHQAALALAAGGSGDMEALRKRGKVEVG
jgi:hypothetical protein